MTEHGVPGFEMCCFCEGTCMIYNKMGRSCNISEITWHISLVKVNFIKLYNAICLYEEFITKDHHNQKVQWPNKLNDLYLYMLF